MLPEYIIEKKLIFVSYFYQKIKKKKYIKKGILLKEENNDIYYANEKIDKNTNYIVEYIDDGNEKSIITNDYSIVNINENCREGYTFNKSDNILKLYDDYTTFIQFVLGNF